MVISDHPTRARVREEGVSYWTETDARVSPRPKITQLFLDLLDLYQTNFMRVMRCHNQQHTYTPSPVPIVICCNPHPVEHWTSVEPGPVSAISVT